MVSDLCAIKTMITDRASAMSLTKPSLFCLAESSGAEVVINTARPVFSPNDQDTF